VTVACVVVNFNGYEDTVKALASLIAQSRPPETIIIVDNGSTNDDASLLSRHASEQVVILRSPVNVGFAGGCNEGIRLAQQIGSQYILILNNDIWAEPNAVESLLRALEQGTDSVACPLIVRMDNPDVVWAAGGDLDLRTCTFRHRLAGAPRSAAGDARPVSFASGCALMVKSEVFTELGLLPERWFLYFEDTDFCARLTRAGRTIGFVPQAVVQHVGGAAVRRSDINYFLYWRNYLLFVGEWMRGPAKTMVLARILTKMAAIAIFNLMVGRPSRARMIVAAATSGLRRDWGMDAARELLR